jgi:hypothetical protein
VGLPSSGNNLIQCFYWQDLGQVIIWEVFVEQVVLEGLFLQAIILLSHQPCQDIAANSDSSSNSNSDNTIQVFMAHATMDEDIEHVYKTKAKHCQSNLQHGWLINSGTLQTMCSHCS